MNPSPAEIRKFILDTFDEDDFELLCSDYFRDALGEFSTGMSLRIKAQRLIEYCQHREIIENLLAALNKERPLVYPQRFAQAEVIPLVAPQAVVRNPRQVFISHAHEDSESAHLLANDLQEHGWVPWITPENIDPGEKWVPAIQHGINECGVMLVILTPRALTSPWVNTEVESAIELAHSNQMRLIPLLHEPCEAPILWRCYQQISFIRDRGKGLKDLLGALEGKRPAIVETPATPPLSQQAQSKPVKVSTPKKQKPVSTPQRTPALTSDLLVIDTPFHLELMRVPAGEFLMGSDPARDKNAQSDEQPQHRVYVSEFYIGKYPVTNAQYALFVSAQKIALLKPKGKDNHPVVNVSWEDAMAFCKWLSQTADGREMRLPTEAEWEKAARGTHGLLYPWGDIWDAGKANTLESHQRDTTPVGKYSPALHPDALRAEGGDSPYGVADMAGNVWEWCADWYNEDEYKKHVKTNAPIKDPTGPSAGNARVLRGGSWVNDPDNARCSYRFCGGPGNRSPYIGFRVVVRLAPVP
jgi:formylglycine-generating enzyme